MIHMNAALYSAILVVDCWIHVDITPKSLQKLCGIMNKNRDDKTVMSTGDCNYVLAVFTKTNLMRISHY